MGYSEDPVSRVMEVVLVYLVNTIAVARSYDFEDFELIFTDHDIFPPGILGVRIWNFDEIDLFLFLVTAHSLISGTRTVDSTWPLQ